MKNAGLQLSLLTFLNPPNVKEYLRNNKTKKKMLAEE